MTYLNQLLGGSLLGVVRAYVSLMLRIHRQARKYEGKNMILASLSSKQCWLFLIQVKRQLDQQEAKRQKDKQKNIQIGDGFSHLSSIDSGDNADEGDEGEELQALQQAKGEVLSQNQDRSFLKKNDDLEYQERKLKNLSKYRDKSQVSNKSELGVIKANDMISHKSGGKSKRKKDRKERSSNFKSDKKRGKSHKPGSSRSKSRFSNNL